MSREVGTIVCSLVSTGVGRTETDGPGVLVGVIVCKAEVGTGVIVPAIDGAGLTVGTFPGQLNTSVV